MLYYAIKRLGLAAIIVCCAITVVFGLTQFIPGDPLTIALGPNASREAVQAYIEKMNLDKPFLYQLAAFFGAALQGDLGTAVLSKQNVTTAVLQMMPYTLSLAAAGITWAALIGIPLGCYSAIRRNSLVDKITGVLSVGTIAIPSFVIAIYSMLIFAVMLGWFPAIGAGEKGDFWDQAWHLVLPAFAVGLGWVGYLSRLVRASMLEVMGENYIRTARAYGLPPRRIIFGYALRVAILPTVTLLGIGIGGLLSGAVFAELIFARPGIGKLIFEGVQTRNFPIVTGGVLFTAWIFVACTLISDLLNAALDPRVRASL